MNQYLEIVALVLAGLLVGNELAIGLFVHPQMTKLDDHTHVRMAKALAVLLGKVMPIWYAVVTILSIAISIQFHRGESQLFWAEATASVLWVISILYSVILEVPLNNEIAKLDVASPRTDWKTIRAKWDQLHTIRNAILVLALALMTYGIVAT